MTNKTQISEKFANDHQAFQAELEGIFKNVAYNEQEQGFTVSLDNGQTALISFDASDAEILTIHGQLL